MQKLHVEKASLTDQLEHALQERNVAMQERTLALQMQQKLHTEKVSLTDQLKHALQEKNMAVQERNCVIQQMQQEYERAERQGTVILSCHLFFCIHFRIHMLPLQT